MWLLDVNLPTALTDLLRKYEMEADTAVRRGWRELTNGAWPKPRSGKASEFC